MGTDPSDLTPDFLTQNSDSSNHKDALSGRKRPTLKNADVSTPFTDFLDGASVPMALHHVARLNGADFSGMFPSPSV